MTNIVPYKKPEITGEIQELLHQSETLSRNDFYKVGGKTVPSARALQWDATRRRISTSVVEWYSDDDRAWAKVAGWIGDETNPIIYKEAVVEIVYRIEELSFILNKAEKGWPTERLENRPEFKKKEHKAALYDYMVRKREYGIRDAITKTEAIVNKKLLSMEFREKAEIEFEREEIDAVRQQKVLQKSRDVRHTEQSEHSETLGSTNNYGTNNRDGTVYKELTDDMTLNDKRDFFVGIHQDRTHKLYDRVTKLLKGRDIINMKEDDLDGIIGILRVENGG